MAAASGTSPTALFLSPDIKIIPASQEEKLLVLPYSVPLRAGPSGQVLGVVSANISLGDLESLFNSYSQPGVVLYVMSSQKQGYQLLLSSVGASNILPSSDNITVAMNSNNTFIAQSAVYWTSNAAPTVSASGVSSQFTGSDNIVYVTSASLVSIGELNWIVVSVANDLSAPQNSILFAAAGVTYDVPQISSTLQSTIESALLNIIRFGNTMVFLTGFGSSYAPLTTPVIVSSQKSSKQLTQQSLWGTANAFHFLSVRNW